LHRDHLLVPKLISCLLAPPLMQVLLLQLIQVHTIPSRLLLLLVLLHNLYSPSSPRQLLLQLLLTQRPLLIERIASCSNWLLPLLLLMLLCLFTCPLCS
jgi:hypothetical protein